MMLKVKKKKKASGWIRHSRWPWFPPLQFMELNPLNMQSKPYWDNLLFGRLPNFSLTERKKKKKKDTDLQEETKAFCKGLYGLLSLNSENNPLYGDDASQFRKHFHMVSSVLRIAQGCFRGSLVAHRSAGNIDQRYQRRTAETRITRYSLLEKRPQILFR